MTLEEFKAHLEPLGDMIKLVKEDETFGGRPVFEVYLVGGPGYRFLKNEIKIPIIETFVDVYSRCKSDGLIPLIRKLDPEIGKDYETREEKRSRLIKRRKEIEKYFCNCEGVEMDWEMDYPYRVTVHHNGRSREYYFGGSDNLIGPIEMFVCFYSQDDHNLHEVKK